MVHDRTAAFSVAPADTRLTSFVQPRNDADETLTARRPNGHEAGRFRARNHSDAGPTLQAGSGWYQSYRTRLAVSDTLVIVLALSLTYLYRYRGTLDVTVDGSSVPYWLAAALLAATWVIFLAVQQSRSRQVVGAGAEEYRRVIRASIGAFGLAAIVAFVGQADLSRLFFVVTLPAGTAALVLVRAGNRLYLASRRDRDQAFTPCVVVGPTREAAEALSELRTHPSAGYRAVGVSLIPSDDGTEPVDVTLSDVTTFDIADLTSRLGDIGTPFAVVIADGVGRRMVRELAWSLENSEVELILMSRLTDVAGPRMAVSPIPGANLVHVDLPHYSRWKGFQKRTFDILLSTTALVLLAPLMAVLALVVRCSDGGPSLFRQTRIGQNGVPFTMHKFRTMAVDAESQISDLIAANGGRALLFKIEDDPRVTPVGSFLRKYSLDELPQFWDVLRGRMCVVGPRPQVAREVAEYTPEAHRRLLIKPGITGLWQVNGRSALSPENAIRLDLRYVENWSLAEDLVIVLRTVKVVLFSRGAY